MNVTRGGMNCDVLVLGAGPGGYAAAIRAGQLGLKTIIIEGQKPGGTCLNVGCIPSKALIHAADEFHKATLFAGGESPLGIKHSAPDLDFSKTIAWKDGIVSRLNQGISGLLTKAGVMHLNGWGVMLDGKTCEVSMEGETKLVHAEHVVLAPGSVPVELPFLPFDEKVISSTEALSLNSVPEWLVVVGGGYIGLELGIAFAKLGSQVSIVEAEGQILPHYDKDLSKLVLATLKKLGAEVLTGAKAKRLTRNKASLIVEGADGKEIELLADKILVTVGRKARLEGWGAENLYLDMQDKFIRVDHKCRTSMSEVFAIGDVTGEPMLAHRAIAQGEVVAEVIAGHRRDFSPACIPAICFTDPEIVVVGQSVQEAKDQGHDVTVAQFPLRANGRAMTMEAEEGFVRVIARKDNDLVLGIQAAGTGVSEMSAAFGLALEMGACLQDIASTIHAHPTQSEAFQEAAMMGLGHALHL